MTSGNHRGRWGRGPGPGKDQRAWVVSAAPASHRFRLLRPPRPRLCRVYAGALGGWRSCARICLHLV